MVSLDRRVDFQENLIEAQVASYYRSQIIADIIHALGEDRYLPHPATPAPVPKSEVSERPGYLLPYRDHLVCYAITMILAPIIDQSLSESVWSWRVKPVLRGKMPDEVSELTIFRETELSDFPFLKKKTIRTYIDEFNPWYALWPKFDEETQLTLEGPDYGWMLFSDISGYFENIQLGLLRDLLFHICPEAPNTINLLFRHLKAWCRPAYDGASTERGIPQGNSVSSFLGNIFLKPVDDHFDFFFDQADVRYFRYMDDIRIVAKTKEDAVQAALALERQIRGSQLNLQTAKTLLLPTAEAIRYITDRRLTKLDLLQEKVWEPKRDRQRILEGLQSVYLDSGDSIDSRSIRFRPARKLNLRTLKRWAHIHYLIGSDLPVNRIADEAILNPDYKITRELLKAAKRFPSKRGVATRVAREIARGAITFDHHEAELLRAIRHFHSVSVEAIERAVRNLRASEADPYVRMQSGLLVLRIIGRPTDADQAIESCMASPDLRVVTIGVLCASLLSPVEVSSQIRSFATHASHEVSRLVQYIRALRRERDVRQDLLEFIFGTKDVIYQRVYDYTGFLRFIACGDAMASSDLIERCERQLANKRASAEFQMLMRFLHQQAAENLILLESRGAPTD